MEFDEIVVKESPGLCRCCLSEGCYKDMGTEYAWMNETEVYADMLLECFDISISQLNDGPNGPNRLICEVCITRLRDACYFKKQVLDSEKKFVDMVGRGDFRPKAVLLYQSNMKAESGEEMQVSLAMDDGEVEYLEDEMDYVDDTLKPEAQQDPEPTVSDVTADPLPMRSKRGRPRKTPAKPEKKKVKVETKAKSSKALVKGKRDIKRKRVDDPNEGLDKTNSETENINGMNAKEKLVEMRRNVAEILLRTTVMPFRWLRSSYRCFYCYDIFEDTATLKDHQTVHTSDYEKVNSVKNYWERTVYVDVSRLSCKLCSVKVKDFDNLIDHLIGIHRTAYNRNLGNCVTPFRLNDLTVQCVRCDKEFTSFVHLLQHTNKNHNGLSRVLCEICGQGYSTTQLLRDHINKEHGSKSCQLCGDATISISRMRSHMRNVHNKRYKCFVCPELFESFYMRLRHTMTVHKKRKPVKCQYCSNSYVFRSAMMRHVRETHLQETRVECKVCGFKAFNESVIRRHMSKHSDERNVRCTECEKSFKTKKTMIQHLNNIHKKISSER